MSRISQVLSSRVTLGVCAIVLAGASILGRVFQADQSQVDRQTTEQECRSEIDGAITVQVAESLLRIELALAAIDADESYSDVVARSKEITKPGGPFEQAIKDRLDAVTICSKEKP